LYKNEDSIYNHDVDPSLKTKFYRLIILQPVCVALADCGGDGLCDDGQECISEQKGLKLSVFIRWFDGDQQRDLTMSEYLYNWR